MLREILANRAQNEIKKTYKRQAKIVDVLSINSYLYNIRLVLPIDSIFSIIGLMILLMYSMTD
jgi:hypothetical protein